MGELATIYRYPYWSDNRVKSIAADNNINLGRRWRLSLTTPAFGLLPQAQFAQDASTAQRHEIACRTERAIGQQAVEDFVTPPKALFAKGCDDLTLAAYTRWYAEKKSKRKAVVAHARKSASDGTRVEICLFASLENCAGFLSGSQADAPMWSSSSTEIIDEFIRHRGKQKAFLYDDDESIAVETLRTINLQGMTGKHVFKKLLCAEWFAEVYHDVVLDKTRWNLRPGSDIPEPVDRIVIGAPLWIRSSGAVG